MKELDKKIFGNKKYSDIIKEIYTNQHRVKNQVNVLINELKLLINDVGDATIVVPLIKDYLEIGIKNDDHLIKMANLIQKIMNNNTIQGNSLGLTEQEKTELMEELNKLNNSINDET